jgi:ribosomal protein S18 acetylase RimI-like enzyme
MRVLFELKPVRTADELTAAASLFKEYAASIGEDLSYQDFDAELAGLPGKYEPPDGELLIARDATGASVGCVGLRALPECGVCEMKRLYVAPEGRGMGLGRALAEAVIRIAQDRGYREIRLDTLPTMASAIGLYRTLGFKEVAPYYDTAVAGTIFLARAL